MKRLAVLLCLLALPSCASFWTKAGTTQSDLDRDVQYCHAIEASGGAPPDGQLPSYDDARSVTSTLARLGNNVGFRPSLEPCLRSQGWRRTS